MKKQILVVAAVVVVAVVGVVVYLYTNLDSIVKREIESYGSAMTGTRVWVESVSISPTSGEGKITGLHIANPPGFSSGDAFYLEEISLRIKPATLTEDLVVVNLILIKSPEFHYELSDTASNISTIVDHVKKSGSGDKSASSDSKETRLLVENLRFSQGKMDAEAGLLLGKDMTVKLPALTMNNVGGSEGQSPSLVGKKILTAYTRKVAIVVATTQVQRAVEAQVKGATGKLPGPAGEALGGLVKDIFKVVPGAD